MNGLAVELTDRLADGLAGRVPDFLDAVFLVDVQREVVTLAVQPDPVTALVDDLVELSISIVIFAVGRSTCAN